MEIARVVEDVDAVQLTGKTESELIQLFSETRRTVARQIMLAAAIVRIFDENQWDVAQLPVGARDLAYLRRVAHGEMIPELIFNERFCESLRSRAARLPLPQQRMVAADRPLEVVVEDTAGVASRLIRPSELTPRQIQQVFAYDRLRTVAEQRSYLEERVRQPAPSGPGPVVVDHRRRCVYVTGERVEITVKQMADLLAQLTA